MLGRGWFWESSGSTRGSFRPHFPRAVDSLLAALNTPIAPCTGMVRYAGCGWGSAGCFVVIRSILGGTTLCPKGLSGRDVVVCAAWIFDLVQRLDCPVVGFHKEVSGLRVVAKLGRWALVSVALVALLGGCMPRGGVSNPGWTTVNIRDHIVYGALATGQVVALDATQQGLPLWTYPAVKESSGGFSLFKSSGQAAGDSTLDAVYGIPIITEDAVLVTSYDHRLHAFRRDSGAHLWDFSADEAIIGGAALVDGVAYFGSSDHRVYAFDIETQGPVWDTPFETGDWVWGVPAVDEDRVYVGSMDHSVYALDRTSGAQVWRTDVVGAVLGSVTLSDGVVFAGGVDRRLYALNADDGSILWKSDVFGGWVWGEALVNEEYVYFGTLDGAVHALSVKNGAPRWEPVQTLSAVRAGPALVGEHLVIGNEAGAVYAINLETGEGKQRFQAEGSLLSVPVIEDGIVYIGTTLGNVYALDLSRPVDPEVWVYPPPKK